MRDHIEKCRSHPLEDMVEPTVHRTPNNCTHLEKETGGGNQAAQEEGQVHHAETCVHVCSRANLKSSQLKAGHGSW